MNSCCSRSVIEIGDKRSLLLSSCASKSGTRMATVLEIIYRGELYRLVVPVLVGWELSLSIYTGAGSRRLPVAKTVFFELFKHATAVG